MKSRRNLLRAVTLVGGAATFKTWTTPIINAVILPVHAQTSGTQLSCAMTDENSNPIAEGATHNRNVIFTFSTSPPEPGVAFDWVGRCSGVDAFAVQTNNLDNDGKLVILLQTARLCSGGPPAVGDVVSHNGILSTSGSQVSCSFIYGP
jgi:hypothetical protein